MNDYHFAIFDNDIIKVRELEKMTYLGYLATISSMVRVAKKRERQAKQK